MSWNIFTYHDRAPEFAERAVGWMARREAENNLPLSLALALSRREPAVRGWYWLGCDSVGKPALAAMLHPGDPSLALSCATEPGVAAALAEKIREERLRPGAIAGPRTEVEEFADHWEEIVGARSTLRMNQGCYLLTEVQGEPSAGGVFRKAKSRDVDLLSTWLELFVHEAHLGGARTDTRGLTRAKIESGDLFVWEVDGTPVSMAGKAGPTLNGIRVNLVFTPLHLRGKGYATACVSSLARQLLGTGLRECYLYTDMANATSNRIYQRIGFQQVSEYAVYDFGY